MPAFSRSPAKKPNTPMLRQKSTPSSAANAMAMALRLMGGRFTDSAPLLVELPACLDDASNRILVAAHRSQEHRVRLHGEHRDVGRARGHVAIRETHRVLAQERGGRAHRALFQLVLGVRVVETPAG